MAKPAQPKPASQAKKPKGQAAPRPLGGAAGSLAAATASKSKPAKKASKEVVSAQTEDESAAAKKKKVGSKGQPTTTEAGVVESKAKAPKSKASEVKEDEKRKSKKTAESTEAATKRPASEGAEGVPPTTTAKATTKRKRSTLDGLPSGEKGDQHTQKEAAGKQPVAKAAAADKKAKVGAKASARPDGGASDKSIAVAEKPKKPRAKRARRSEEADDDDEEEAGDQTDDERVLRRLGALEEAEDSDEADSDVEDDEPFDSDKLPSVKNDAALRAKLNQLGNRGKAVKTKGDKEKPTPGVLYFGRLPKALNETTLRPYLEQFGTVLRLRVARNKRTGAHKHYAFVEFEHADVARVVRETMDNYLVESRLLQVREVPQDEVHPRLWIGANRKFRPMPTTRAHRVKHNAPKTPEAVERATKSLLARQEVRRRRIKDTGIKYDFPGYVSLVEWWNRRRGEGSKAS